MSHATPLAATTQPGPMPTVLIIDDNEADRALACNMLRPAFRTLEAFDIASGLEVFRREQPDCVLLDNRMPGSSGLDAIVEFAKGRAVVIMVSGSDGEDLAAEAIKRGAHDFIHKDALTRRLLLRTLTRERERRLLENALTATEERFDEVAARIPEVLWVRSLAGEFLYLSPAFEHIWGRRRDTMTRADWEQNVHPDDRHLREVVADAFARGREYEIEYRITRPDGAIRRVRSRGYPIFEAGAVTRYGGITRDITEETRLHEELRLAQKLEAIGQLAAGVAHEINTPAQYVSDNIAFLGTVFKEMQPLLESCRDLLRGDGVPDLRELRAAAEAADLEYVATELPRALEQSAAGIGQIAHIVKAMKEFAHPADDVRAIDVNHAIETTVTVARNEWKYVADVSLELEPDLPVVACNPSEINQVLLNLIVNSAHAIEDVVGDGGDRKGRIRIRTRGDGDHVEIAVSDDGCGVPDAIRERIYDPFFTTKEIGKGTGQGLAIAHRIVTERHGGTIRCDSTMGKGTTFVVRLPFRSASSRD